MDSIHGLTHVRVSFHPQEFSWGFLFTKYFLYFCIMLQGIIIFGIFGIILYWVDRFIENKIEN